MIRKERLFTEDIINIFTDASITEYNNETIGCAGYVAIRGKQKISEDRRIIRQSTNNNSEITAISMGVEFAISILPYIGNNITINLFSDSKICIFGLREWYTTWLRREYNGRLYSSANKEIANQEIFNYIIWIIMHYNLRINFYHQNGHICLNSRKSLLGAMDTFKKYNYITNEVDIELIKEISKFNDYIDNTTRDTLKAYVSSGQVNEPIFRAYFTNDANKNTFNEDKYRSLVNAK